MTSGKVVLATSALFVIHASLAQARCLRVTKLQRGANSYKWSAASVVS
jgi:hypothetical protein